MLICYDYWFPEVWRVLSLKGVNLICHPSNLLKLDMAQSVIPVYAMLNKIFIATVNRVGKEDNMSFCGSSIIASPEGKVMFSASENREEVQVIDILVLWMDI